MQTKFFFVNKDFKDERRIAIFSLFLGHLWPELSRCPIKEIELKQSKLSSDILFYFLGVCYGEFTYCVTFGAFGCKFKTNVYQGESESFGTESEI